MDQFLCPVDVISVCSAEGEIRPLRLQLCNSDQHKFRVDIEEVLSVKEIPYVGVEAHVFLCRARVGGRSMTLELKYTFRTHTWCLLRRLC